MFTTCPFLLYTAVASPKYQTLPALSGAYQSVVFSRTTPPSYSTSFTTVVVTPWITFFHGVTVVRLRRRLPSSEPRRNDTVPGSSGKYGFGTGVVKSAGSTAAAGPTPGWGVAPAGAPGPEPAISPIPTMTTSATTAFVRFFMSFLLVRS